MSYPRGSGVPHRGPASDELWSECIDVECPYCRAQPGVRCHFNEHVKRTPCTKRILAAQKATP